MSDAAQTARIVAFLDGFRHITVNVGGQRIDVSPPYYINTGHRRDEAQSHRSAATGATRALLQSLRGSVLVGKSSPSDIRSVLQRVVDGGVLGRTTPDATSLRAFLQQYGIGVDCSGFVVQALNDLMELVLGSAPTGADRLQISQRNSASLRHPSRDFRSVTRPRDLRPGDTMFKSAAGNSAINHIRLVSRVTNNSDGSVEFETAESSSVNGIGPTPNTWRYPSGERVQGLQRRNGSSWQNVSESNVYSRFLPLERALTAPPTAGVHAFAFEDEAPPEETSQAFEDEPSEDVAYGLDVAAERANRGLALQVGWGRMDGATLRILPDLATALGISETPTDTQLADAVTARQRTLRVPATGRLDEATFRRMAIVPTPRFRALRMIVRHGGATLGILEKTTAYGRHQDGTAVGVTINLGFRVTNPDAVRRAGFVLADGTPNFRIIQVLNYLRGVETVGGPVLYRLRAIDPSSLRSQQANTIIDAHPYYEDGLPGDGTVSDFRIDIFRRRVGDNGLFYDLLFTDEPAALNVPPRPVDRRIRAFETALVGVRTGGKNVILNTVRWGYDVLTPAAGPVDLRSAALRPGPFGGSDLMRSVLERETRAGTYPGHCFVGTSFARDVRCA